MKKYLRLFFFKSLLLFLLQSYFLLQAQSSPTLNWQMFSGSMNIFNSLRSFAKPLQYQPALNTISFIQRKSATYSCSPDPGVLGQSGVIVAMISSNWGAQWDSTCIWTDTSHFGRYPQGAISNPPGNQTLSNAYVVSTGPVVNSFQYSGFYSASKVIGPGNYNNSPGTAANAMQYFPTTSTLGTCYYAGNAFSATDNGLVHSLAYLSDPTAFNMHRGAMLLRGTYANNAFNWIADSLPCDAAYYAGGFKCMHPDAMMAWNRAGTVGYVVFMASRYGSQMTEAGNLLCIRAATAAPVGPLPHPWILIVQMQYTSKNVWPPLSPEIPSLVWSSLRWSVLKAGIWLWINTTGCTSLPC